MLNFLISRLSSSLPSCRKTQLGFLPQNASFIAYSFSAVAKLSQSNKDGEFPFTVSYLMNKLDMSAEVAYRVSKRVELKTPDKPDSSVKFLRSYGFSETQISRIVKFFPQVLLANPEKTLLPKLRFVHSIGFSDSELTELFSGNPALLVLSLEKRIIPYYEALRKLVSDECKVKRGLTKSKLNVCCYGSMNIFPNIKVLRDEGVPQSSIVKLLCKDPNVAFINQSKFVECVKFVKETGIQRFKVTFIDALIVVIRVGKSKWESRLVNFERFGWSRDVTLSAFSKFPNIMGCSEEKITNTMKFCLDEIGLQLVDIADCPTIFSYSLKQRIIPRWSVAKILKMKGLIKADMSIPYLLIMSEKNFRENFVIKFQERVPQLLELYRGELRPVSEVLA